MLRSASQPHMTASELADYVDDRLGAAAAAALEAHVEGCPPCASALQSAAARQVLSEGWPAVAPLMELASVRRQPSPFRLLAPGLAAAACALFALVAGPHLSHRTEVSSHRELASVARPMPLPLHGQPSLDPAQLGAESAPRADSEAAFLMTAGLP